MSNEQLLAGGGSGPGTGIQTITGTTGGALTGTNITFLASTVAAGTTPAAFSGAGTTETLNLQFSQAIASTDATKVGLSVFNSNQFSVDANGFVSLAGGGLAVDSFTVQNAVLPGVNPVVPTATGDVTINGAAVSNAGIPIQSISRAINAYNIEVQYAANTAATDVTKVGLASFKTADFTVDANGFVAVSATGVVKTISGTTGGSLSPTAGNIAFAASVVVAGTTPAAFSGAASTETLNLQLSQAVAGTDITRVGLSNFNSTQFSVDSNGWVSLIAAAANTITGDSGPALTPNWSILGQQAGTVPVMDTIGTATSTLKVEDRTWQTQYVVDASTTVGLRGTFTTIQAAINAATSPSDVYIRPGTYAEDLSLKAGVDLIGPDALMQDAGAGAVKIIGKASFSSNGNVSLSNIILQTNGDYLLEVTGSNSSLVTLNDCFLYALDNTAIHFTSTSASSEIRIDQCTGAIADTPISLFTNAATGTFNIFNTKIFALGSNPGVSTSSGAGLVDIRDSSLEFGITLSSTAGISIRNTKFNTSINNSTCITAGGSAIQAAYNSQFFSGTASAISISTTMELAHVEISSSNASAIAGAGTVKDGSIVFLGSSSTIGTTTQVPFVTSNDALKIVTPGAYPYTTKPQDAVILVDSAGGARTITPLASPTTGQQHVIKDSSGNAATNNITITPSGKNIDGAASSTMNVNYGSVTIVYGGSEWHIT